MKKEKLPLIMTAPMVVKYFTIGEGYSTIIGGR
jgi:hypothetical protein